ncbi:MAG: glycosyltransferase family 2 protein [Nanoarchaeota archaeon]
MIFIIITAFKEEKTIGNAIEAILKQTNNKNFKIIVTAPDEETGKIAKVYEREYTRVRYIKDEGKGKPAALNVVFSWIKNNFPIDKQRDILILTDGDIYIGNNAISEILEKFNDPELGVVSGRPISLNLRKDKWGYYSHLLTDIGAHETRLKRIKEGRMIVCSGYLYAFRVGLINKIAENALSEDALISHLIYEKGYKTGYAEKALVFVKYPDNFKDWIKQKRRSAGGYNQLKYFVKEKERMRSFAKETKRVFSIFSYPQNIKEFIWTFELLFYRLYLWLLIFRDINIKKKSFKEIWVRVESTK